MPRAFLFLPVLSLALVAAASAAAADRHVVLSPDAVKWEPATPLPAGAEWSVIYGKPAEPGPFAVRVRFPTGYAVPAHWHSRDEAVTVLSGTFAVGMGETADRDKVQTLTAGGFFAMPANMRHYAFVTQEAVVQINGVGPFDLNYVDPAEDPRRQVGSSQ
ncbi:cupin domain-containing protein [Azospirillum sp.]|uniref:cupin domain-containing protein n=1 Tax=Azospirillum sp. TaxID=34012 RepID=UPI003D7404BF